MTFIADVIPSVLAHSDVEETVVRPSTGPPCILQELKGVPTSSPAPIIRYSFVHTSLPEAARQRVWSDLFITDILPSGIHTTGCPGMGKSDRRSKTDSSRHVYPKFRGDPHRYPLLNRGYSHGLPRFNHVVFISPSSIVNLWLSSCFHLIRFGGCFVSAARPSSSFVTWKTFDIAPRSRKGDTFWVSHEVRVEAANLAEKVVCVVRGKVGLLW